MSQIFLILILSSASLHAQTLIWDNTPGTGTGQVGIQNGSGNWNLTTANWLDSTNANVLWTNSGSEIAQFGGTGTVAVASTTVTIVPTLINLKTLNFMGFNTTVVPVSGTQYTLQGQSAGTVLNFGNNGFIQLADYSSGGSQFATLGSNIVLQGSNLTIQKTSGTVPTYININGTANTALTGMLTIGSYVYAGISGLGTISAVNGITVKDQGTLVLAGTGDYNMPITAAGYTSAYMAIRVTGSNVTLSGGLTLTGSTGILMHSSNTGLLINAPIVETGPLYGLYRATLTKTDGTVTLTAANTYSGTTTLGRPTGYTGGITVLDFAGAAASGVPVDDILYHNVATAGNLDLVGSNIGSSILQINGKANTINSQRLGAVNLTGIRSAIEVTSGAGGTVNLTLGTINRNATTSVLALSAPASGSITTTSTGIFGPWLTYKSGAGVASWGQVTPGTGVITNFTGNTPHATGVNPTSDVTKHLTIGTASTGNVEQTNTLAYLSTISMADPLLSRTLATADGQTLRLAAIGGVQITSDAKSLTVGELGSSSILSAGGSSAGVGQLFLTNNSATSLLTINSMITNNGGGAVSLYINGAAASTTILTNSNSFTGGTTIASGALEIRNESALGSSGTINIIEGGSLRLTGDLAFGRAINLAGVGTTYAGDGAIRSVSGNNTLSGLITLVGTTSSIISDSGTLTINAGGSTATSLTGSYPLNIGGSGTVVVDGRIATAAGTVAKVGTGTLYLGGDNTFTSILTISAGVIRPTNVNAFGTTAGNTVISAGAAIELAGDITLGAEPITTSSVGVGTNVNGGIRNVSGNNTITGPVTLGGVTTVRIQSDSGKLIFDAPTGNSIIQSATTARILVLAGAGSMDILDPIARTSTGALTISKEGNGTVTLAAANSNTATTINGGTLKLDFSASSSPLSDILHTNAASSIGDFTMGGGTLLITGKGVGATNSQIFGPLVLTGNSTTGGTSYLTVAQNSAAQINLTFGASFTRAIGGTLGVTLPTTGTVKTSATTGVADNSIILSALNTPYMWSINSTTGDEWLGTAALSSGFRNIVPLSQLPSGGYTASTAIALSGNANIAAGVTATSLTANTTITSLRFAQAQETTITQDISTRVLTVGGILVSSTAGAFTQTITGGILKTPDVGIANDLPIIQNNTQAPLIIASNIPNQTTGGFTTTVIKSGPGTLILKGVNTFTGSFRVQEGIANFQAGSISASTEFLLGSGDKSGKIVLGVGTTAYNTAVDWLQVMGTGTDNRIVGGASVISTLTVDNPTANNNFRTGFLGGSGTNENNLALSIHDDSSPSTTMLLPLGGANTYAGQTRIRNGTAEVSVLANKDATSSFGTGSASEVIEMGNAGVASVIAGIRYVGTTDSSTNRPLQIANTVITGVPTSISVVLENNGTGSLKFTAPITSTGANTTTPRTLRLTGTNMGANEIVSVGDNGIRATVLEKTGVGTWTVTGDSSHTGGTSISNGTLQLGNGGTGGNISGGGVSLTSATAILSTNHSNAFTLSSAITGTGKLNIANTGTGTTILTSNTSTWTGGTSVITGTLLANNTVLTSSATGTGSIYIGPGATLGGTGRIGLAAGNTISVVAGTLSIGDSTLSTLAPANLIVESTGTGSLSILATSNISFDLFTGAGTGLPNTSLTSADRLTVLGTMTLGTDVKLSVNANGLSGFTAGDSWKLFDWSGLTSSVNGTFKNTDLPVLSDGLVWSLNDLYTTGVLRIDVVPEPGRAVLLVVGLLTLAFRRSRRHSLN